MNIHYHFDEMARRRIWHTLTDLGDQRANGFGTMLEDAARKAEKKYGSLVGTAYRAASLGHPLQDHFFFCPDPMFIQFIEDCFQSYGYIGVQGDPGIMRPDGRQKGVEQINEIMREHSIGYQFTDFVQRETGKRGRFGVGKQLEVQYPRAIMLDNDYTYMEAVKPALELLRDPRFKTANDEFLKAYEDYRDGDFQHAMTQCGSAFESVLKIICQIKGWTSDPSFDPKWALAKTVQFCSAKNLFPTFYEAAFIGVGTIRNALSSAHGRGGAGSPPTVTKEQVDHLLSVTAAHILIVISMAKI